MLITLNAEFFCQICNGSLVPSLLHKQDNTEYNKSGLLLKQVTLLKQYLRSLVAAELSGIPVVRRGILMRRRALVTFNELLNVFFHQNPVDLLVFLHVKEVVNPSLLRFEISILGFIRCNRVIKLFPTQLSNEKTIVNAYYET